ncbi:hypothetical protein D3C83_132140 [compost metagenome]
MRPRLASRLRAVARHADVAITKIGVCTGDGNCVLRRPGRADETMPAGYSHFR